jgi:hypothetical protein
MIQKRVAAKWRPIPNWPVPVTPAEIIPMLKEHNVRTGFFEREQFDSVRSHLPTRGRSSRLRISPGWRIPSEVLPRQWRQVDLRGMPYCSAQVGFSTICGEPRVRF